MFIDEAKIFIKSGEGGNGKVSFLRQKYLPWGGPDGGNGGKGGSVYFVGSRDINTLLKFKYEKSFVADSGNPGEKNNKAGAHGKDLYIKVPIGTQLTLENDEIINIVDETPKLILYGGKGGIGNGKLASSTNQSPKYNLPNGPSEEMFVKLKLRLIGDIGLIGLPNAGKSSFINCCTNANSMVANYAFTTLEPCLGTYNKLIIVDIPGIIEGASQGKGLGLRFLSHIEKCKKLLMIIDISNNPIETIKILLEETASFGIKKDFIIALNKIELVKRKQKNEIIQQIKEIYGDKKIFNISIHKKSGIKELLTYLNKLI